MKNGIPIIDADSHVMEPRDLWQTLLPAKFRDRGPRSIPDESREWATLYVDGQPIYRHYPDELVNEFHKRTIKEYGPYYEEGFSARSYVQALEKQGIDKAFLYPSLGLGVSAIDGLDGDLAGAINRSYNSWLLDFCSYAPEMLYPVGLITLHSADTARAEIQYLASQGVRAVIVRPNPVNGRPVGHQDFDAVWGLLERLNLSVGFHEGCHTQLPAAGADRFSSHFGMHACCHPMEQMMAFTSLVESGTFERHPGLKVAFLEAGAGWVPYLMWRLDELEYKHWKFQIPDVKRAPSEYFRRQCWVTVEGCEPGLNQLISQVGEDRLLFASDFPHPDHSFGEELAEILSSNIPDPVRQKILWDNPSKFYGLS